MKKKELSTRELFQRTYQFFLSERTLKDYLNIIDLLERDELVVKSKSRFRQVKSVLTKLDKIGRNDYNFIIPETFPKRSDRTKSKTAKKTINEKQLNLILSACLNTIKGKQLKLAIKIAFYGGLRLSEVLNLKRSNIIINQDQC